MDNPERSSNTTTLGYLIQEGRAQDPEVLQALIGEYAARVHQFASALCGPGEGSAQAALLLTGEAFFRAVRQASNAHHFDSLHTWLLAELLQIPGSRKKSPTFGVEGQRRERAAALSAKLRLPLLLRYNQDLTIPEISQVLKTSEQQIHRRLKEAREALIRLPPGKTHQLDVMHAVFDGQQREEDSGLDRHLANCETCAQAWNEFNGLHRGLLSALRPEQANLGSRELQQVLDIAEFGRAEREPPSVVSLPLKELVWMILAVTGFILIFQGLSPLWTGEPVRPATATPAPSQQLGVQAGLVSYENLVSVLVDTPPPAWVLMEKLAGEIAPTSGIEFSPEGHFAAYGREDSLILLDLDTSVRTSLGSPDGVITAIAFSGGNRPLLATGNEYGNLRIWGLDTLLLLYSIKDFPGPVHSLAFSPDGRYLVAGGNRGIWVFEDQVSTLVRVQELEWGWIRSLAVSPDGQLLAAADRDRTIAFWTLPSFEFLGRFDTGQRYTTELAFSPDSHRLAAAGFDGTVQVIGLLRDEDGRLQGSLIHTLEHPSWVSDVAWLGDGQYLASISAAGEGTAAPATARGIFTWEMSTGLPAELPFVAENDTGTNRLHLTPAGEMLTASFNGNIYAWFNTAQSGFLLSQFFYRRESNLFDNRISGIPKGNFLAISSPDRISTTDLLRPGNPLLQDIPLDYRFYGSSFTNYGSEQYFYVMHPRGRSVIGVSLRIRPLKDLRESPVVGDFIGADAPVRLIKIGETSGELVQGEWAETSLDPGEVFRWMPSARTRFRWVQNDLLIEVSSQSPEMDPDIQWQLVLEPIVTAVIAERRSQDSFRYIVHGGDTCSAIAGRYGTTVERIEEINGLDDCSLLSIGQELTVKLDIPPEIIAKADLNCDGVPEIIRRIPAGESLNGTPLNFGMLLEALISGVNPDSGYYLPVWQNSITSHDVEYYTEPILFSPPGECHVLVAVNGYGGGGREAGLSIFQWTGSYMQPILSSAGALNSSLDALDENGLLTIRTTRLTLNATLSSCIQTDVYYEWRDGTFNFVDQNNISNIDCLGNTP